MTSWHSVGVTLFKTDGGGFREGRGESEIRDYYPKFVSGIISCIDNLI